MNTPPLLHQVYKNYNYLQWKLRERYADPNYFLSVFQEYQTDALFKFLYQTCLQDNSKINVK